MVWNLAQTQIPKLPEYSLLTNCNKLLVLFAYCFFSRKPLWFVKINCANSVFWNWLLDPVCKIKEIHTYNFSDLIGSRVCLKKNKQVDHLENLSCHQILMGLFQGGLYLGTSSNKANWSKQAVTVSFRGLVLCTRCIEMDHISYALLQNSIFCSTAWPLKPICVLNF